MSPAPKQHAGSIVLVDIDRLVKSESRKTTHNLAHPLRTAHLYRKNEKFATVLLGKDGKGTRDAVEAWDNGAAAFNNRESPYCLAY